MEFTKFGAGFIIRKEGSKCYRVFLEKYPTIVLDKHIETTVKKARLWAESFLDKMGEKATKEAFERLDEKELKNKFFDSLQTKALFLKIFGKSLDMFYDYKMWVLLGTKCLDVFKFDDFLKTPDGVSTYNHIKKTYGEEALRLVKKLM